MLSRIRRPKSPGKGMSDGVNSLIGGSGVSLDGESLQIPGDDGSMRDEVSSVNTSNYGGPSRPLKSFDVINNGDEPSMLGDEPSLLGDEPSITAGVAAAEAPPKEISGGSVDEKSEGGWVPGWMKGAPGYFKAVILLSIALLVGAIVLVIVAAVMAGNNDDNNGGLSSQSGIEDLSFPPSPPTNPPSWNPSASPSSSQPTITPMPTATPAPTEFPTTSPTEFPTATPSTLSPTAEGETLAPTTEEFLSSSLTPSQGPSESSEEIIFYVTAGRFQGDVLDDLPNLLKTLPDENGLAFMVHLGDWNSPFATGCSRESYETVYELYGNTSVPTYFVVGDNEYNDCPNPQEALGLWYEFLLDYEIQHWAPSPYFNVERQREEGYAENFAFRYKKILFVGINLVGGQVHDEMEWQDRFAADLNWIDQNVNNNSDVEILVVFAHADPDISATASFFAEFYDRVDNRYNDKFVAFIHRNLGVETSNIEFVQDDFALLIVEGQVWPPMRVRIDTGASSGFGFDDPDDFDFNQIDWYANEVQGGG